MGRLRGEHSPHNLQALIAQKKFGELLGDALPPMELRRVFSAHEIPLPTFRYPLRDFGLI